MRSGFRFLARGGLLALVIACSFPANADDALDELRRCAKIPPVDSRIACYETLGARVLREERISASEAASAEIAQARAQASVAAPAIATNTSSVANAAAVETATVAPQAASAVATVSATDATTPGLPDNFGGAQFEASTSAISGSARARVSSCPQSGDKKWNFIFENGQIWKQTNSDNLRLRTCDFMVTIEKDTWGYRMKIDGKTRPIRVKRMR